MSRHRPLLVFSCFVLLAPLPGGSAFAAAAADFSLEQVMSYPFPNELAAAARASRIAWAVNDRGQRNLFVAEAPDFAPRRLTAYTADDGQELTAVQLSPDGTHVVYVRGGDHGGNFDTGLPVNPTSAPVPPKVEIWTVPFAGGAPKSLGEGGAPVISPRGDRVAFVRRGQVWTAAVDGTGRARQLFTVRGTNGTPVWSPEGSRLAFVSNRGTHSLIGIYTAANQPILWLAPSTGRDSSPRWSPDGRRLVFVRQPGAGGPAPSALELSPNPWALWVADASTGAARPLWSSGKTLRDSLPTTHGGANLHWAAGGRIVFLSYHDGWPHLYSIAEDGGEPRLLTPGNFMAEHIRLAPDRRTLVFSANTGPDAGDLHRRHVVAVSVDRAEPRVLTPGTGLEWGPVVLGDGATVACLSATPQRPPLPAVVPLAGGPSRLLGEDRLPADYPTDRLVTPRAVTYVAADGVTVHAQQFERPGGGGRRPAIVYIHGGPPRQMLLGWHYSDYYANAYALNQYLAARGFVVLAVNYRLGIGYGHDFHRPPQAGARGASEYRDIKAAALYLRGLPQVDPARLGVYGGSYGGFLTALALGRDSELFAAGVDIHGVHDFTAGNSASGAAVQAALGAGKFEVPDRDRALEVAWQSSPVSWVAQWRSPVLLIHADDDRNVRFSHTVELARRLELRGVEYEELVIVDDTHHWMRYANLRRVNAATAEFLERKLRP